MDGEARKGAGAGTRAGGPTPHSRRQAVPGPARPGPAEVGALAVIAGLILWLGTRLCLGTETRLAYLLYDDAYYYLGVARSLAAGLGSTFDGINPTNGYHPLWCALLVPVFWLTDHPGAAVRIVAALWFAAAAAAPLALWWALRPRTGPAGAVLAAALFGLQPLVGLGLERPNGLETPLYALLIALFAGAFERGQRHVGRGGWRHLAGLGLLLGLVITARLDGGLMAVAAALLLAAGAWPAAAPSPRSEVTGGGWLSVLTGRLGAVGVLAVAATAVAGPFMLWGALRFGSPMPVSGRTVSQAAAQEREEVGGPLSPSFLRRRAYYGLELLPRRMARAALEGTPAAAAVWNSGLAGSVAVVGGAAALIAVGLWRRRADPRGDALGLLALFGLLHYGAYAAWLWTQGEETYRLYYLMPQAMLLAAAAGAALGPTLDRRLRHPLARRSAAAAGLVVLALLLVRAVERRWALYDEPPGPVTAAGIYGWVRASLPEAAVLGARDAGKLGYFSGRPVVNLDGLINDHRLLAAIAADAEDAYIAGSRIDYLLYDRDWVVGFPAGEAPSPEAERAAPAAAAESLPRGRERLGAILRRLDARPGITLREVPGAPDNWLVLQVQRHR